MMVDPLLAEKSFTKALPLEAFTGACRRLICSLAVHAVVAIGLLAGLVLAVMRWRGGDDYDADNMHALLVLAPTGLALVGSVSFKVPGMFGALLLCVTAAAVWYAVLRPLAPYEDEDEDEGEDDWETRPPVSRRQTPISRPGMCRSRAAASCPRSPPAAPVSATWSPSIARASRTSTTRRGCSSSPRPATGSAVPPPGCSWRASTACRSPTRPPAPPPATTSPSVPP